MTCARDLHTAPNHVLREHILRGFPVDPRALEGWAYRGTSLGLPDLIVRLTWRTFQKTFHRDVLTDRLLGWNVRLEQDGINAPSRPKTRGGRPITEWNYEVVAHEGVPMPRGFDRGLVVDYSRAPNPPGVVQLVKDPLVALNKGDADHLLGVSYLVAFGVCIETPTYFTLEREHRINYVPDTIVAPRVDPLRLTSVERRWTEALFDGILGTDGSSGLPPFSAVDKAAFWRTFEQAPGPLVRAGLRPMVHLLTFLPIALGFKRPFFRLTQDERAQFLSAAIVDRRYAVRQAMATLKTLACFAYFEDPSVRSRFESTPVSVGLV